MVSSPFSASIKPNLPRGASTIVDGIPHCISATRRGPAGAPARRLSSASGARAGRTAPTSTSRGCSGCPRGWGAPDLRRRSRSRTAHWKLVGDRGLRRPASAPWRGSTTPTTTPASAGRPSAPGRRCWSPTDPAVGITDEHVDDAAQLGARSVRLTTSGGRRRRTGNAARADARGDVEMAAVLDDVAVHVALAVVRGHERPPQQRDRRPGRRACGPRASAPPAPARPGTRRGRGRAAAPARRPARGRARGRPARRGSGSRPPRRPTGRRRPAARSPRARSRRRPSSASAIRRAPAYQSWLPSTASTPRGAPRAAPAAPPAPPRRPAARTAPGGR